MPSTAGVVVPVRINTKKKRAKEFEEASKLARVPRVSHIPQKDRAHHAAQVSTDPGLGISLA